MRPQLPEFCGAAGESARISLGTSCIIQPVALAGGRIGGEARLGQLLPLSTRIADPLIAIAGRPGQHPRFRDKILQEGIEAGQVGIRFRTAPTSYEQPFTFFGCVKPGGIVRRIVTSWPSMQQKAIGDLRLPRIAQITLPSGAFVAKFTSMHILAFS